MKVDFTGERNTILVLHYDKPGLIAAVTNLMAEKYKDVNIGNFRLTRPIKGGEAMMTMEIDGMPPQGMIDEMNHIKNVINILLIRAT
jgi:L-serine dehydratase